LIAYKSPGATETPIFYGQFKTKEEADARKETFKKMTPLGRMGRPEEMAKAILFLGSDDSSYTTDDEAIIYTRKGRRRGLDLC
jgi:NAD(P)-dependent dehydrogenase (short-subunit alcohol dehydrogenase family)